MRLLFNYGNEVVIVSIEGTNVTFANQQTAYNVFVPIDALKLSLSGIYKEFPDLQGLEYNKAREETIKRFKDKISKMGNENEIAAYIMDDLQNYGYVLKSIIKNGFRIKNV